AGKLGVPGVTFNGVPEGTWAGGRRLVLASSVYDDQTRTRFVVIDTRTLRALRTIALRGAFAFDALSPDGRRMYVLQYPQGVDGGTTTSSARSTCGRGGSSRVRSSTRPSRTSR